MKCVVGLGNPGRKYAATRHNVGYMVLDKLAQSLKGAGFEEYGFSDICKVRLDSPEESCDVLLVRPVTYMNESGKAVLEVMDDFQLSSQDILVIHDDMDLPFGKIRVKRGGSSGGHRGIESIISLIGTEEFPRLKVGIGRPEPGSDAIRHVLDPFTDQEKASLEKILDLARACAVDFLMYGVDVTMSRYNGLDIFEENDEQ